MIAWQLRNTTPESGAASDKHELFAGALHHPCKVHVGSAMLRALVREKGEYSKALSLLPYCYFIYKHHSTPWHSENPHLASVEKAHSPELRMETFQ